MYLVIRGYLLGRTTQPGAESSHSGLWESKGSRRLLCPKSWSSQHKKNQCGSPSSRQKAYKPIGESTGISPYLKAQGSDVHIAMVAAKNTGSRRVEYAHVSNLPPSLFPVPLGPSL